jgi:S-methylmethionine-dependent homocysteine/selenocysteine methylase
MSYESVRNKLSAGQVIILDGGTGTDIQRRGAPMSGETWCADANRTHPHIVQAVHEDYIRAGADIITANTFATSVLSFNYYGRDAEVFELDNAAIAAAKAAARGSHVAIAGSMSTMRPVHTGTDRTVLDFNWTDSDASELFSRKAENLKLNDVDFIIMEMMRDKDYSLLASKAAKATGLPFWIGISVEMNERNQLTGFGRPDQLMIDFVPALAELQPDAICVMHTSPNNTDAAVRILRELWDGPIGCYPECGYFKAPEWQFIDVITPTDLVAKSHDWKDLGATIFGGCCGIGPDHIGAIHTRFCS